MCMCIFFISIHASITNVSLFLFPLYAVHYTPLTSDYKEVLGVVHLVEQLTRYLAPRSKLKLVHRFSVRTKYAIYDRLNSFLHSNLIITSDGQ